MARRTAALVGLIAGLFGSDVNAALTSARTISVTYDAAAGAAGLNAAGLDASSPLLTGRVRVYLTRNNDTLPYESDADEASSAQVFGVDVIDLTADTEVVVDSNTLGYPRESLLDLEDGTYYVQAELVLYDKYTRANLPPVSLPTTCVSAGGANGAYAKPDGTLFTSVEAVTFSSDGVHHAPVSMVLDRFTPKATSMGCAGLGDGVDSDWIKTVRIKSELLSAFWGRDIEIEACVLIPMGFYDEEHKDARYPIAIAHGHYDPTWNAGGAFSTEWPDCDPLVDGYDCEADRYSYYLYSNWTDTASNATFKSARFLVATLNHPVPLFDDSYAVNSANLGPYGDAINTELIPAVETQYRGIGEGWARGLMGGSTGGWESLAVQVLYPDLYNSAFAACPDPITFTSYTSFDIYSASNAYYYDSDFKITERPGERDFYSGTTWSATVAADSFGIPKGQTAASVREMNRHELVMGTSSRSCGQWDIWEAVFGPVGPDGYPARMYDKLNGQINKTVAEYWRENFDLQHIMERDWATLGPKLQGKLHIFVGADDTFFLTNAVMDMEDYLTSTTEPASDAEVVVGTHKGRGFAHCFRGYEYDADGQPLPNSLTRLMYLQAFVPKMADHFASTAPEGSDVTSWRY